MREHGLKQIARRIFPESWRHWMRQTHLRLTEEPPYKMVRFGSLRRVTPIHPGFSLGRGTYVDRYYIERFVEENSGSIHGRVLEFADNEYTTRFGGARVTQSDVLDVRPGHPQATIISDLTRGDQIPSDAFDCVILTQVLNFIYDLKGAVRTLYRVLKPAGCVLVSVPGIAQIARDEMEYCGDYWRFTNLSLRMLFEEVFPKESIAVESHGNVLAAIAFLHGLGFEELRTDELDYRDPDFELTIVLKAVKPSVPVTG